MSLFLWTRPTGWCSSQYRVTIDSNTNESLYSITAPTISGDKYWYDSGTAVKVILNGIWGRTAGEGYHLVSYSSSGRPSASVASLQPVVALSLVSITLPASFTSNLTVQYQLTTRSGSLNSVTSPSIAGDTGWYDSGTMVRATYNYAWNETIQARSNAVGLDVDDTGKQTLPRAASGTFSLDVKMDKPHAIDIISVNQFHLSITGGSNIAFSSSSPTNDSFYDSGSILSVTTDYTWSVISNTSRQNLVSYTVDGQTSNVTRAESGVFSIPTLNLNTYHDITFNSVTQYFVSFSFTDNSGLRRITPTALQIDVSGAEIRNVTGFSIWLDNGSSFKLASVRWEGVDVKPLNAEVYNVSNPLNTSIRARIFNAKIVASDYLGLPISGATTTVQLANGTILSRMTSSNGTIVLPEIPLGKFNATISNLGFESKIIGDASVQKVTTAKVVPSTPFFGVIGIAAPVAVAGIGIAVRRRGRHKPSPTAVEYATKRPLKLEFN